MFETLTFTVDYEKEYKKQLAENCSLEAELHNLKEKTYRQKMDIVRLKAIIDTYDKLLGVLQND
ncbi:MAG: hypothetical protein ACLUD1_07455 [Clostridia bacterium]